MPKRAVSNLLALAVLTYLTQRPMHPYELQRNLRENDAASTFKLSYGALYAVVRQLAKAGFIVEHETVREGNLPERTVYRITDAGRAEMYDWLREILGRPRHEYPAFAAALSLIVVLEPGEVVELLTERLACLDEEHAGVRRLIDDTVAGGVHPLFLVEDEYRLALLEAESGFIRGFIESVTRPGTGWAGAWAAYHDDPHGPSDGDS